MKPPFVRSPYNYDMNEASDASGLACKDPSLAKQSFADEVNINTIVERFGLSGDLPTNVRMPAYDDFTGITDFHSAMNAIAIANEAFDRMPANVRHKFHNDPAEFVDFCLKDENREEATRLGLVDATKAAAALAAQAGGGVSTHVNPTPPAVSTPAAGVAAPPQNVASKEG